MEYEFPDVPIPSETERKPLSASLLGPSARLRRSSEITQHECEHCPSCRGGSSGSIDHYAMGRLRMRVGEVLGLDRFTTQQLDLKTLLERHTEAGSPALGVIK